MQQTYQNIEIVIVDNNSSDNTVKNTLNLVSGNNKVTVIKNFENFGPVLNWLKGVHLSKEDIQNYFLVMIFYFLLVFLSSIS